MDKATWPGGGREMGSMTPEGWAKGRDVTLGDTTWSKEVNEGKDPPWGQAEQPFRQKEQMQMSLGMNERGVF